LYADGPRDAVTPIVSHGKN